LIARSTDIKMRAERRVNEMLREMRDRGERKKPGKGGDPSSATRRPPPRSRESRAPSLRLFCEDGPGKPGVLDVDAGAAGARADRGLLRVLPPARLPVVERLTL
jgi:hypothetical protein